MYLDPETNTYTSESPEERQRKNERDTKSLEKRVEELEKTVERLVNLLEDRPPHGGKIW
ncbi:hypothetical protein [Glutamicibacter arilaitensis]|uniref:hypothetical protein n=1 Tax=Glutamicibacter arilaitensis TaxID=256701 RepID=UPI003A93A05F